MQLLRVGSRGAGRKRLRKRGRGCARAPAHHQALPGLLLAQGFYYQAVSKNATLEGNVFFNGPRAGINVRKRVACEFTAALQRLTLVPSLHYARQINDGFAGGHLLTRNCGFNLVRETLDHGVVNSW